MNRKKNKNFARWRFLFFNFSGGFLKEKLKFLIGYVDMEIE